MCGNLTTGFFVCLIVSCFASQARAGSDPEIDAAWIATNEAGVASYRNGAYAEAISSFEKCWTIAQTARTRGTAASNLGASMHALGRAKEARIWLERAVEIWRAMPNQKDAIARASLGLADADRGLADFEAAERTLRAAIDAGPSPDYTAQLKNRLADLMREQGRNEESRRGFLEVMALPGVSRPPQIDALLGLADLDRQIMRWNESMAGWNKALSMAREEGSGKAEALALRGLGLTHLNRGDLAEAEPILKRSLALFEKDKETPPQQLANALHCMGSIYLENHRYTLAEEALLRALAYLKEAVGDDHPQSAIIMQTLAQVYVADNHFTEARQYAAHAYATMCASFGKNSASAAESLGTIALVEQHSGDLPAAGRDYELALKIMRISQSAMDQRVFVLKNRYAAVLAGLHRNREATQLRSEIRAFQLR